MGYTMNGFSGFGNSPAKDKNPHKTTKDSKGKIIHGPHSDLYVQGTGDYEGSNKKKSYLATNTKYKADDDIDETEFDESKETSDLAKTNIVQDITQVRSSKNKYKDLNFSKEDWEKSKS
tara:strand:+ start:155 stop:511 length:357 start_codon:yes stop_codon:yes gene_type:complete